MITKLDDIFAIDVQILTILQLTHGIFSYRFHTTLDVIYFDTVVQFFQLIDKVTNFLDHQVRSKIRINLVYRFETIYSRLNPFKNSVGCIH